MSPGNHHIIGAEELRIMRPSAFLINIARGGLIDEAALAEALKAGKIAGAALDVFEDEPVIHPGLMGLPNVVLTPHIGGGTLETQHGLASLAADNLIAALGLGPDAGRPPCHPQSGDALSDRGTHFLQSITFLKICPNFAVGRFV